MRLDRDISSQPLALQPFPAECAGSSITKGGKCDAICEHPCAVLQETVAGWKASAPFSREWQ